MNKTELINAVAEQTGEKKVLIEKIINSALNVIPTHLAEAKEEGGKVQLIGFGTFSTSYTKERMGRNPKNKEEEIQIPASYRVYFSAGKSFKDIVNDKHEVATKTTKRTLKVVKK